MGCLRKLLAVATAALKEEELPGCRRCAAFLAFISKAAATFLLQSTV